MVCSKPKRIKQNTFILITLTFLGYEMDKILTTVKTTHVNYETNLGYVYIPCRPISKKIELSLAYANGSTVVSKIC